MFVALVTEFFECIHITPWIRNIVLIWVYIFWSSGILAWYIFRGIIGMEFKSFERSDMAWILGYGCSWSSSFHFRVFFAFQMSMCWILELLLGNYWAPENSKLFFFGMKQRSRPQLSTRSSSLSRTHCFCYSFLKIKINFPKQSSRSFFNCPIDW